MARVVWLSLLLLVLLLVPSYAQTVPSLLGLQQDGDHVKLRKVMTETYRGSGKAAVGWRCVDISGPEPQPCLSPLVFEKSKGDKSR